MQELMLKKCSSCGALVKVLKDCHCACNFECCGTKMVDVVANSEDASFEKHVPNYEKDNGKLKVYVNHVMEEEHYIEWICLVTDNKEEYHYLEPGIEATVTFNDVNYGTLYAYCNKHGLWKKEI